VRLNDFAAAGRNSLSAVEKEKRMADTVFVGLKGTVLAIDRTSGQTQWSTELKGSDFVNVSVVDGDLYAACRGRIYRLDPDSGTIQWCNELPGLGWGLVTIAGGSQIAPGEENRRRRARAAAAAAS
jgi:outer membrane protein assembly factor BamB